MHGLSKCALLCEGTAIAWHCCFGIAVDSTALSGFITLGHILLYDSVSQEIARCYTSSSSGMPLVLCSKTGLADTVFLFVRRLTEETIGLIVGHSLLPHFPETIISPACR